MSDHHHHHRRQNEFSPDMSVQPEDGVLKVGHFTFKHIIHFVIVNVVRSSIHLINSFLEIFRRLMLEKVEIYNRQNM